LFDISVTGVTGHYRSARVPFEDRAGQQITDLDSWNRARNQQRNWETVLQLISLRSQPLDLQIPDKINNAWVFTFCIETPRVFDDGIESLGLLLKDCEGVPMLNNLGEARSLEPVLRCNGTDSNIWFKELPINN
jgi:hypothetical protein